MGAGPSANYELWLVNDHLVDPSHPGQALAAAIDTGSGSHPFIAMHRNQPGEQFVCVHFPQWVKSLTGTGSNTEMWISPNSD